MSDRLDSDQLRERLDALFKREKAHENGRGRCPRRLAALQGQADRERIATASVGDVEVIPVRSELELRRHLPPLSQSEGYTAFILDWPAREVPVDIAGRFVASGRVTRIDRTDRLRHLFSASKTLLDVDRELVRSKLARYLVAQYARGHFESTAGRITLDGAWAAWLKTDWGLDAGSALGLDSLLAWAGTNQRASKLREVLEHESAKGLRKELDLFLTRRVGDAGPAILECWLNGGGRDLLRFTALFEVVTKDPQGAPTGAIRSMALGRLNIDEAGLDALLEPLGKGAGAAFLELGKRTDTQSVHALLHEAQDLLSASAHPQLAASPRLPVAWGLHLDSLGTALRAGANAPSIATLEVAVEALRGLQKHDAYVHTEHKRLLERAQMAARLLAWLVARPDQVAHAGAQSYAPAQSLALWYAQEGGYVDWARRRARSGESSTFSQGVCAVVEAADAARLELDRRFAKAYVDWLRNNRPTNPLLPIDAAVSTFVAPYLAGGDQRRMLVLLMDGMAWAQAVEILQSLGNQNSPWLPLAWNTTAFAPGRPFTPVMAQLPSETKVSRSAFFAGKPTAAGIDRMKLKDEKLWGAHKALAPFYTGTAAPKLRLKGNGFNTDGSVTKPTLTLIADENEPVVGLVINAIDDHLDSSPQEERPWTADAIVALRELLDAALAAGRSVMFASDHGHVSGQRLSNTASGKGGERGSRWRTWHTGDTISEYEVQVESAYAWAPKGDDVEGVILLADDQHSYSAKRHYGEHGGATLAEVVTPTFVLGNEGLKSQVAGVPDSALEGRQAEAPNWWHLEVQPAPAPAAKAPKKTKDKAAAQEAAGQLTLVKVKPPAKALTPSTPGDGLFISDATRSLVDKLAKNAMFKARVADPAKRAQAILAVELLIERDNSVSAPLFAQHLGTAGYRVGGLVSNLGEVLNVDGYEVIAYEVSAKMVTLNLAMLREGFGL